MKELEGVNKAKIKKLQEKLAMKEVKITELLISLKESQLDIDELKGKLSKIISEFKSFKQEKELELQEKQKKIQEIQRIIQEKQTIIQGKEAIIEEKRTIIEEKQTIIDIMTHNKAQMKEVFLSKEKENQELCKKIEQLHTELVLYNCLDTSRFSSGLRSSLVGSFLEDEEPDNLKFFSKLLCEAQGILYKNRTIEVGFCLKLSNFSGRVLIYIGNCSQKPLEYLETTLFSPELEITASQTIENSPIPPQSQAHRTLSFTYTSFFTIFPRLIVQYNSSKKTLQLPISPASFLPPCNSLPDFKSDPTTLKEVLLSSIPSSKLQSLFSFYPCMNVLVSEPYINIFCSEVMISLFPMSSQVQIEITSKNENLINLFSLMCKSQINLNESIYL